MLVQSFLHRAVSTNDVTPQPTSTRARSESLDARYERRHMQRDEAARRGARAASGAGVAVATEEGSGVGSGG